MADKKRVDNYLTGYVLGLRIREFLEAMLGLAIIVMLWIVPLCIFDWLGIGY